MIIYLHGFRSAPASSKAQALKQHMEAKALGTAFWCEQLPFAPKEAIALVEAQLERCQRTDPERRPTLVGSSLGGYYATWLAEKHDLKAAVINPAVKAPKLMEEWLGPQTNMYTGEEFVFTREHAADLQTLAVAAISRPRNFWLLSETGDELLDYRDAVSLYADCRQTIIEGGDHSFTRWNDYLDQIIWFAGLESSR